ncbi:MAG: C-GCAxxG-C-C family (seleno)protein [Anaerolineae bacterium]
MSVVDDSFNYPLALEEHATMPLAGGIEQMGYPCGQLWGAALAAGAEAYRLFGPGPRAEAAAVAAAQRLVDSFQTSYKSINCFEVTELDWKNAQGKQILKFFLKGGPVRCFGMTADFAQATRNEIDAAFSGDQLEAPAAPVSCAATVAQKLGASEMHTVMAAGLAGGIGLSGGACGALGAAIWLTEMNRAKAGTGKVEFNSPEATEAIDRFVQSTECEFECAKIVGRKFVDVHDHASYLCAGGCAKIIEALAAFQQPGQYESGSLYQSTAPSRMG